MTVKGQTLQSLLAGSEVSGQDIADMCSVSRTAVWKAVQALQAEGYGIEARTNGGYRLTGEPEALSEAGIEARLHDPCPVRVLSDVDSTNAYAKRLLARGTGRALIAAEHQSAGRGRMGRDFYSPQGTGLYMTLLLPSGRPMGEAVKITVEASVAVCRALEELCGEQFGIKWVNDIYYGGKKVCGILTEAVGDLESGVTTHLVLGVGVNVRPAPVPEALRDIVGWLPRPVDRNALAAGIANQLSRAAGSMDYYRSRSLALGKKVRFLENGLWQEGFAREIDDTGALMVETEDGAVKALKSGEISLRLA